MKRYLGWILLVLLLVVGFTPYALKTDNFGWETAGETTTAYTSPAVNERDYTNLVANHADAVIFTLNPFRYNIMEMRFIVNDDTDSFTYDVFASKKRDFFNRMCTLQVTAGTVSAPGITGDTTSAVFCEDIVVTNEKWWSAVTVVSGTDTQAKVNWDLQGYDTWAFIATTVSGTTSKVQITGH